MTELDDLKSAWQSLNRNLERQHALALHQFRDTKISRFRSGFRPLSIGQIVQLICGVLLAVFGGTFWVGHRDVAHLLFYGLAVHAYGIMFIVFAARDLYLIKQLDYAAPVLALQKQLAALRSWHRRTGLSFGLVGSFIWIPIILMIFFRLGADVWINKPSLVGWFVVSGGISAASLLAVFLWSRRPGYEKLAKNLDASSAGYTVRRAQSMLGEIERFERE